MTGGLEREARHHWDAAVTFELLDIGAFRDGRPYDPGASTLGSAVFPRPSTMVGATQRAYGVAPRRIAGPFLVSGSADLRPLFPTPRTLVTDGRSLAVLRWDLCRRGTRAVPVDGAPDVCGPVGHGDPVGGWLTATRYERFLATGRPDPDRIPIRPVHRDPVLERRVGAARRGSDGDDDQNRLYAREVLDLRSASDPADVLRFGCLIEFDRSLPASPTLQRRVVPLGGEGRLAAVDAHAVGAIAMPSAPTSFPGSLVAVVLATPGVFAHGWRPNTPVGAELVGACSHGPESVAHGAAGRWRVDRAVSAGSVFVYRFADEREAGIFASSVHGRCLPQRTRDLRSAGFGLAFAGSVPMVDPRLQEEQP